MYLIFSEHLGSPDQLLANTDLILCVIFIELTLKGQYGQAQIVDDFFHQKNSGFFVEAGAWDGVYLSNTLFLERQRNWTGILIEPNNEAFDNLTQGSFKYDVTQRGLFTRS